MKIGLTIIIECMLESVDRIKMFSLCFVSSLLFFNIDFCRSQELPLFDLKQADRLLKGEFLKDRFWTMPTDSNDLCYFRNRRDAKNTAKIRSLPVFALRDANNLIFIPDYSEAIGLLFKEDTYLGSLHAWNSNRGIILATEVVSQLLYSFQSYKCFYLSGYNKYVIEKSGSYLVSMENEIDSLQNLIPLYDFLKVVHRNKLTNEEAIVSQYDTTLYSFREGKVGLSVVSRDLKDSIYFSKFVKVQNADFVQSNVRINEMGFVIGYQKGEMFFIDKQNTTLLLCEYFEQQNKITAGFPPSPLHLLIKKVGENTIGFIREEDGVNYLTAKWQNEGVEIITLSTNNYINPRVLSLASLIYFFLDKHVFEL